MRKILIYTSLFILLYSCSTGKRLAKTSDVQVHDTIKIEIQLVDTSDGKVFEATRLATQFVDTRDGNGYDTIRIGNQVWMAKNLAYLPKVYEPKSDSGYYVYGYEGNDTAMAISTDNYKIYGCLYSWPVAMNIKENEPISDTGFIQGICPDGWHLPGDDEWKQLEALLETYAEFPKDDERRITGNVGNKIKADYTWESADSLTNQSGFSALPSGFRYKNGHFDKIGKYGYFWTSTEYNEQTAIYRYLKYDSDGTYSGRPSKQNGMPVRCVKNQ